ncbi:hypothetical protein ACFX1Q_041996 [Malus domestica]
MGGRRFRISMVYSKALSCGGTVKSLESRKASREERVPWWTIDPFDSKRILPMVERILKLGWWIDKITVRWREVQMEFRVWITLKAKVLSRPEVGSSRRRTAGSWRRLRPI